MDRNAALEEVRKRLKEKKGGFVKDPNEFKPSQVKPGEEAKYKFIVLPPLQTGETCASGKVSRDMAQFFIPVGAHWVNKKPYECPRIHDQAECKFCQLGFDLLGEEDDEEIRKNIVKTYLARATYAVNIYFPSYDSNPEELRGRVMWYSMPKTVFDIMEATLMRDASKDDLDPQAYGFFYLPDESYVFQLEVSSQGGFNAYKTSKFLYSTRGPMIKSKDGVANSDQTKKVLDMRHDLYTKFAARDQVALAKLANEVLKGEPGRTEIKADTSVVKETVLEEPSTKTVTTKPQPALVKTASAAVIKTTPPSKPKEVTVEPDDDELNNLLKDIRQS